MIKKVQTKAKGWKIHTQLMVLILLTGLASILLFEVLWLNKWDIYEYVQQVPGFRDMSQDEIFGKNCGQKLPIIIFRLLKMIRRELKRYSHFLVRETNIRAFIFIT